MKTTNENNATFADLLVNFATEHDTDRTTATYATALTDLATAVAYSVLKKCINTSYNETLVKVRNELTSAKRNLTDLAYANSNAMTLAYNDNGDLVEKTLDPDLRRAANKLISESIGDGLDLVNAAVVAILNECVKQADRDPDMPTDLERPYTVRRLKRKVWIKTAESVNGWETVETSPIKEIYKAVRRAIMSSSAMATDPRNGYSYLSELATDPETGENCEIYRRLNKYADIGGYATDFNGACTFYTVDKETVDRYDTTVASLNLTKKQATVLRLRQAGYGYDAIATYLGVCKNAVVKTVKAIQKKAIANGLDPEKK